MKILVGDSGLVGTTLKSYINFDYTFNSKNIKELKNIKVNNAITYLSCLPATKWIVNKDIKHDIENINQIVKELSYLHHKQIILISTIDVYCDSPLLSDELSPIYVNNLSYGVNRYFFELLIKNTIKYENLKIFRLPALFNKYIKKNILFDLLNNHNISNLNINSSYQWYNLDNLHQDIEKFIHEYPNETIFNLFTEPIETCEIIKLFPEHNKFFTKSDIRVEYNYKTKFSDFGYIKKKSNVLDEIKNFINEFGNK